MNGEIHTPQPIESGGDISTAKCEQVKACIDSYLSKNTSMSLQSVEDKTGIPISTLRRIVALKGNPNPETVIKIFLALGFDQKLDGYMQKYHPEIASAMAANRHNNQYNYVKEDDAQYFVEESSFLIMNLAHTSAGTTVEDIRYELGERGVAKTEELLRKNVLFRTDTGRIVGLNKEWKLSFKDTFQCVGLSFKYYRLDEAGRMNNFLNYQTESLNPEGIKALKSLNQVQAIERREKIFNNPSFQGFFPVFNSTVSSTFVAYTSGPEELQ